MYSGSEPYSYLVNNFGESAINSLLAEEKIVIRNCDAYCFELAKEERQKLIKEYNLADEWENNAPYFYPNSQYGEVTRTMFV